MLEICGNLARNLVLIVFVNLLLEMLLPQGNFQRYIRLVTGLIVVVLVVGAINVFLGKVPAYFEAVPTAALISPERAEATREQLVRFNRKQALSLYTAFLEEAVRREVEQGGSWSLVEMDLLLEDDPEHERYGELYRLNVAVKRAAGAGGEVEAVRVDPVTLAPAEPGAADGAAVDESQRQRAAALERALAERLQLSPGIVTVTVVE